MNNGTPQGSVTSPTIFNIMIADKFKECIFSEYALFADDGLIMLRTNNLDTGLERIQSDIHSLERWTQTNGLKFSINKTKCIFFQKDN